MAIVQLGPPAPVRNFWQRCVLDPLVQQLTQGISADKLALSIAVGSCCAFFPILGAATPLCVAAGFVLRLNQPVIQLVNCVTSPLYLPIIFGFVRLGDAVLAAPRSDLQPHLLAVLLRHDPAQFLIRFGALAGHAVVGWGVLCPMWVAAGYFVSRPLLRVAAARFAAACAVRPAHGC